MSVCKERSSSSVCNLLWTGLKIIGLQTPTKCRLV